MLKLLKLEGVFAVLRKILSLIVARTPRREAQAAGRARLLHDSVVFAPAGAREQRREEHFLR